MALVALLGHPFFAYDGDHAIARRIAAFHDFTYAIPDLKFINSLLENCGISIDFFWHAKRWNPDMIFEDDGLYPIFGRPRPSTSNYASAFTTRMNHDKLCCELDLRGFIEYPIKPEKKYRQFYKGQHELIIDSHLFPHVYFDGHVVACKKIIVLDDGATQHTIDLVSGDTFSADEIFTAFDFSTFIEKKCTEVKFHTMFVRKISKADVDDVVAYARRLSAAKRRRAKEDAELNELRKRVL